jgi:choline trimethylamine-lyase
MGMAGRKIGLYSERIVESVPSDRVESLITDVHQNMDIAKTSISDYGSVMNEETKGLSLIVRKAMAEKQKLSLAPAGIWDNQIFAGCYTFKNERLANSNTLPFYAFESERLEGEKHGFGIYSMFGHISPDYPRLLKLGISGIKAMAEERLNEQLPDKSRNFLQAAIISLEGLNIFAKRHSDMLYKKAETMVDNRWKKELIRAADALAKCPQNPATTYFEACQATWLLHLAFQLTGNYLALGRPDQYLNPYLEADLMSGGLTIAEAQEITDCFLLKFNERAVDNFVAAQQMELDRIQRENEEKWRMRSLTDIGQQRYNVRDTIDAVNHWNQNIIVGGVKPEDGSDATNYASVMIVESFRRLKMTNPVLSVRIHKNTPDWFYRQIAVTLKTGGGLPAIYNDEVIVKSYTNFGIEEKDARDYANNGCWEVLLPGRTDFYFLKLNALKCLEWSLNHGACHVDGKMEVPDQGNPADFITFDILFEKLMENIRYVAEGAAVHMKNTHPLRSTVAPTPLLSALLDGPIENGRDMTDLGTRFVIGGTIAEGISHVIDSLCAIDKLVYKDKKYTMSQLADALDSNFAGYREMHADFSNCPKYGSNDPTANEMGERVIHQYYEIMKKIDEETPGMKFMPGVGTFSWFIAVGEGTGASADGRLLGEAVASNFSPSVGAMINGITGAIQSFCHMGLEMLPLGSPIDVGMAERYVAGEEGTTRLVGLLKSFVDLKGNMLTISVADVSTLKKAQEHPENYRDLRVRMGGWSAYFTMLSGEQQEHHIKKSEMGIF